MIPFKNNKDLEYRYEKFGGIISSQEPPFLAYVDRDYMRELGLEESALWKKDNEDIGLLSAPTEVHFAITNKCSVRCPHCYMASGDKDENELDTPSFKRALDVLASMKVFHIALGGGDALEREDLFEIADYAREKGIVPNLTVSGVGINENNAEKMRVFGQVNFSIDGFGEKSIFRGQEMNDIADRGIDLLIGAGVPTGINCVLGNRNFDEIEEVFKYAVDKKLNEIEFLRLKPSGRGEGMYASECTTYEQNIALFPKLSEYSEKYKITAKIDCSFVPMLCYHSPPVELLETMATYGCEAGNILLGIKSDGSVSGCSFLKSDGLSVFDLPAVFSNPATFANARDWTDTAPEPCISCKYLDICKGGCHGVAEYVSGSFSDPDPGCPYVIEYQNKENNER